MDTNKKQSEPPAAEPRKSRAWIWKMAVAALVLLTAVGLVALLLGWHEPKYSEKPLSYWLAELNGTNYVRRQIAAAALANIGAPAIPPLRLALHSERPSVYVLRDKVWRIAPPALQKHIPKPWATEDLQYNACIALAAMGPEVFALAPELVEAFTNSSPAVVNQAAYVLKKMGTNAHPALLAGMKSPDIKVATECRTLLQQANVPVKKITPMFDVYLKRLLSLKSLTKDDFGEAIDLLNISRTSAIKNLEPMLTSGDGVYRGRVAILLAYLQVINAKVTETLVKEFDNMPLGERPFVATALENQRPQLQPYFKELQRMAADPQMGVAVPIARVLEKEFADSGPKWALMDRALAGGGQVDWAMVLSLLTVNVRTGLDLNKAFGYMVKMLNHPSDNAQREVLLYMWREYPTCVPLIPEVERYQQGLTTNAQMRNSILVNTLQALKQAETNKLWAVPKP